MITSEPLAPSTPCHMSYVRRIEESGGVHTLIIRKHWGYIVHTQKVSKWRQLSGSSYLAIASFSIFLS